MFWGSEEPLRSASTHFIAPVGTRQRASGPGQAPKSSSSNHLLTSKPREAVHRASGQRPDSEETFRRLSTRLLAPGGVRQRASESPPSSEEPVSDTSTRIRTPESSSPLVRFASRSRRTAQQTVRGLRASKEHINERPICFRNPKKPSAKRCLASEYSESTSADVWRLQGSEERIRLLLTRIWALVELIHKGLTWIRAPKRSVTSHVFASQLSESRQKASDSNRSSEEPFRESLARIQDSETHLFALENLTAS